MTKSVLESKKWSGQFFTGDWVTAASKQNVMEPATGGVLSEVGIASADDIYAACQCADAAHKEWAKVPPRDKSTLFHKAAAFVQENFDELALYVARETGGIIPKGQHEVKEAILILQLAANMALESNGVILPTVPGKTSSAIRKPIGVIGVISPFNFPLILSIRSIAPALATGNAVVTKPDLQTPVTGGFILALALEAAGFPKGLFQVLPGSVEAGEALCSAPEIGMVAFTGSTAAGRKVGEVCGRNLKKVSLELGGKNSLIILEDADLEVAASNIAWGAYFHQGQICMASGRVLVQESIAEALTAKVVEKARHMPVGDPVSGQVALGPLINQRQLEKVHGIVQDTVAAGARLEAGGTHEGLFYAPTVLSNVKPGMRSFDEEVFGPVANIVTFKHDSEAVAMANDTEYGLSGAVISNDVARAQNIGSQLHVGLLHINDQTVNDECINPFGGCGASGNGSAVCGPADWDLYTHWQWVTVKQSATPYPF
ncbi:Benzaldehyde dehydrogenase [NAD(+)] [Marinomonas gallaica]|uniref:Benzaldehyde dehydrogenase [NAD(+)] n=1 Tax=Marinomonas gallaica TaxID=1806667 RepID=A0A1C3JMG3_9GAMM|nr:benzaldehyde dehydrogenase [Marinomonas gallaica]SBT16402.1 Benzaldehyde dehydrogenase [NAD(+)] [Marinomonas gallaica]SBT21450.1 Benzaldehyde dehydrogenase [NAD(+)] [Marinomonas gallaica]